MPINRRSLNILSGTGTDMNKYSIEAKGDAYYGYSDGHHTVQVIYSQFVGRLRVQATLSLEPTASEWFDIIPSTVAGTEFNAGGYVQFNSSAPGNVSEAYTFQGNFTYVRVYMDREHVGDGSTYDSSYGQISSVILSA
tara:strand:+ start:492 stop:905 length:414 start_codon:yes stop_codon:yes gene_type:complete